MSAIPAEAGGHAFMPSSFPHLARSAAPAASGSAPPPELRPATAGHTGLPLSIWPGVPGPG
ncbi:MAG: hypothetical protein M3Z75_31795, partial [Actinomycetota bacterium]|nr:hypothetical protein [Actinomycetota bacterium]